MTIDTLHYHPEGFFADDLELVREKLGAIALDGPENLHAVLDFDRTMTTNGPKDLTSWDILSELLPPDGREKDNQLWMEYQPLELDHTLTRTQAETWWNSTLGLYTHYETNVHDLETAAESIQLRDGTQELFQICQEAGVHTSILSAGVKDVIQVVVDRDRLEPDLILSTELTTSEDGTITGWKEDSVIHILNKGEKGSPQLIEVRKQRPNALLVGDALEDTAMVDGTSRVIRIRVGDPHKIDPRRVSGYLEESFLAGYDLVRLGDLRPVATLAKWLIGANGIVTSEDL